jgi:peptide/nickel transport system substrate-binding protein
LRALLAATALALPLGASAAARAALGGTLSLGLVGLPAVTSDSTQQTPEVASARALLALPLCRLQPQTTPVLASLSREGVADAEEVAVRLLPVGTGGGALSAVDIADAWQRLVASQSPYLALLAPVAGLAESLAAARSQPEAPVRLRLKYGWPDLEASLCHPAFAPVGAGGHGIGLYAPSPGGRLLASAVPLLGAPFPAALSFSTLAPRPAQRLFGAGQLQAVLGEGPGLPNQPLLFATYLVYRPQALPEGVAAALAAVDRTALVRTFVPGPAVAMRGLLPPALLDAKEGPKPVPAKAPTSAARAFTLGYEASSPEQRSVAERLQVILHDAGFHVRLHADSAEALARARAQGQLEATLVSLLLPPLPAAALALVLGLAEDEALLARELPPLGALGAEARAALAQQRAAALLTQVPVVPLYARGLRAQLSPRLKDAAVDGFGLLVLDDAWVAP